MTGGKDAPPIMSNYNLSPGQFTNLKYWVVCKSNSRLQVKVGRTLWLTLLMFETGFFVMAAGFLGILYLIHHPFNAKDRHLIELMGIPFLLVIFICPIGMLSQMSAERRAGDILRYDPAQETLGLPRAGLSLKKSQIIEFRVLQVTLPPPKYPGRYRKELWGTPIYNAELQVTYNHPNEAKAVILQTAGWKIFKDVIKALKDAEIAKVILAEKKAKTQEWLVQEL